MDYYSEDTILKPFHNRTSLATVLQRFKVSSTTPLSPENPLLTTAAEPHSARHHTPKQDVSTFEHKARIPMAKT